MYLREQKALLLSGVFWYDVFMPEGKNISQPAQNPDEELLRHLEQYLQRATTSDAKVEIEYRIAKLKLKMQGK